MRVWTVQVSPPAGGTPPRVLLLRDGFALGALLLPPLWLLAHRLVALAGLYLAVAVAIAVALPAAAAAPLIAGLNLFIGFEARNLQGWWLGMRGWRTEAVVMGRNADAAFLHLAASRPDLARAAV